MIHTFLFSFLLDFPVRLSKINPNCKFALLFSFQNSHFFLGEIRRIYQSLEYGWPWLRSILITQHRIHKWFLETTSTAVSQYNFYQCCFVILLWCQHNLYIHRNHCTCSQIAFQTGYFLVMKSFLWFYSHFDDVIR